MIYIILPIHNRKVTTEKFIKSLIAQTYKEYKLILIDDGSTDGTDKMVLKYLPDTHIIYGNGNLWWGGSLQKGYEYIKSNLNKSIKEDDIIFIDNDDTEFDNGFFQKAISLLKDTKNTIIKSWSVDIYTKQKNDGYIKADIKDYTFEHTTIQEEANCISTRGVFLKAIDFIDIGEFYPKLLPHYGSDYEWSMRAYRKGYRFLCDDSLYLYSDSKLTGIHSKNTFNGLQDFIQTTFSIRNSGNPIYSSIFIYLASDDKLYAIKQILRLYYMTFKSMIKIMIGIKDFDKKWDEQ